MLIALTMVAAAAKKGSGGSSFLLLIILGLAAMWLIFIRPQRRKQKQQQSMQSDLMVGDEILTAGGVYGKVTQISEEEDEVRVEIAPNVEIRLARRAIAAQLTEHEPDDAADEPEDASDEPAPDAESDVEKPG